MMPWGVIEAAIRLVTLLVEGIPAQQRTATAVAWFWMWWPLGKRLVGKENVEQIEAIMRGVGQDLPSSGKG